MLRSPPGGWPESAPPRPPPLAPARRRDHCREDGGRGGGASRGRRDRAGEEGRRRGRSEAAAGPSCAFTDPRTRGSELRSRYGDKLIAEGQNVTQRELDFAGVAYANAASRPARHFFDSLQNSRPSWMGRWPADLGGREVNIVGRSRRERGRSHVEPSLPLQVLRRAGLATR
jgi:hypothetical protein